MQDKKPESKILEDNVVIVPTREYVKGAIKEHAQSRNHPYATQAEPGFVTLSNAIDNDSEITVATSKAVKKAYDLANTANLNALNNNSDLYLEKKQNGADIPDKAEFVKNIGLEDALKTGDFGIGSINGRAIPDNDYDNAIISGVYAGPGDAGAIHGLGSTTYGPCLVLSRNSEHIYQQANYKDEFYYRYREYNKWGDWYVVRTSANTMLDSKGYK